MRIIKDTENIFILLARGIGRFVAQVFFALGSLLFFKKINTIEKKYPFLEEMLEKWPKRFEEYPTGIKIGRALFHPILFLFSHKKSHDKNP